MKRIVILGGSGLMGRIIAQDLARTARGIDVVIADREPPPSLAGTAGFVRADVREPRSLARALSGATVAIGSLPYRLNEPAMRGALAAGAHWVDLGGLFHQTRKQLRLSAAFRAAKRTAILGIGSSPGITNVLAVLAARGMDEVREVHVRVGNVDLSGEGGFAFGYSPDTLLDELVLPAAVFHGGRASFARPLDAGEREVEVFPAPIGAVPVDITLHSELATLPSFFAARGAREVTFKQSFEPPFLDRARFLVELGLADAVPVDGLPIAPRRLLLALLARRPAPRPSRERHEVLRAIVVGRTGGRMVRAVADCVAGPESGWSVGPDSDTGAPPSIAARMLVSGEIDAPGAFAPERVIPADAFVRELARRDLRVSVVRRTFRERATSRSPRRIA